MKKERKERSPESVGFKEIFGVTALPGKSTERLIKCHHGCHHLKKISNRSGRKSKDPRIYQKPSVS